MGPRRADWSVASSKAAVQRPSWATPANAPAPRSEGRPQLKVLPSVKPPPPSVSRPPEAYVVEAAAPPSRVVREHAEAIAALTAEVDVLKATAADLAAQLATTRRRILEASEGELVKLAIAIAGRVVGEAVAADPALIVGWANEAIAMLPPREAIVVAMSPDLAAAVPVDTWTIATEGEHRLEVDRTLPRGTCEVRAKATSIEVSAGARMAAVGEAIGAVS
ncbi:MAG: hypothetical protein JWP97_6632 [Labilithrix sp.]|nr:hypothetical protein [Labilithrix sp.]